MEEVDEMRDVAYLKLTRRGISGMTKNCPKLSAGEYAVKLVLTVDDRFFEQAIPTATLDIDDEFLVSPVIVVEPELPEGIMGSELGPL